MKYLVVSDNHGDQESLKKIINQETYDKAIHCGDALISSSFLDKYFDYWVPGNNDNFPKHEEIFTDLEGLKTLICHGHTIGVYVFDVDKPIKRLLAHQKYDLIIHGHTHIYRNDVIQGAKVLCPGSTSMSRGSEGNGYMTFEINNQKVENVKFIKL